MPRFMTEGAEYGVAGIALWRIVYAQDTEDETLS